MSSRFPGVGTAPFPYKKVSLLGDLIPACALDPGLGTFSQILLVLWSFMVPSTLMHQW